MNFDKNLIILVLGMHRSGTSALTSALVSCGGSVGENLKPASFDNPKGFFENIRIVRFNNRILKTLEMSWDTPILLPKYWTDRINIDVLRIELEGILHQEFIEDKPIVIKDPRICLIFPIWVELLKDYEIFPVVIVREPSQVRKSLYTRNRFGQDKSNILWLNHYIQVINYTQYFDRIVTDFDALIKSPKNELKRILKGINDKRLKLNTKLESLLKNNKSSIVTVRLPKVKKNQLSIQADSVYASLKKIKAGETNQFLENVAQEYLEINTTYIESVLRKDRKQFTLIAVDEKGNRLSELKDIGLDENHLIFNIKSKSKITELILIPCNDKAYLSIKGLKIEQLGKDIEFHKINKNVLLEFGIEYVVNSQSFFVHKLNKPSSSIKVEIDLTIFAFGINTIDYLDILSTKLNTWIDKNINQVKKDLQQKDITITNAELELNQYKIEFEELMNKLEKELQKNNELTISTDLLKSVNSDFEKLKIVKEDLLSSKTKITKTLEQEKVKFEEMKSKLASREFEIDTLNESMRKEDQRIRDKEKELNETQKKLYQKDTEIEVLKLKLEHLESNMQLKIDILKQGMEVLRKENEDYKENLLEFKQNQIDLVRAELRVENFSDKLEVFRNLYHQAQEKIEKENTQNRLLQSELGISHSIQEKILDETDLNSQALEKNHESVVNELLNYLADLEANSIDSNELEELRTNYDAQKRELEILLSDKNKKLSDKELLVTRLQVELQKSSQLIDQKENAILIHKNELESKRKELLEYKIDAQNYSRDLENVKQSVSYKVGTGLTKPARWVYDKTNGETPVKKSRLWLIKNLILGGIKNPVSAVMKLSPKNLKTLHQAMQSESNETIIENFNNLISNKKVDSKTSDHEIHSIETDDVIIKTTSDADKLNHKVLFICPSLPDYDSSAGGKRAFKMLCMLSKEFNVFIFTKGGKEEKYVRALEDNGIVILPTTDIKRIKKRIPKFETIIYAWYSTFYECNDFMQNYPSAQIILDSVDIHWIREERSIGNWDGIDKEKQKNNKKRELEAYANADIVWVVTEPDKQAVLEELPELDIRIVSIVEEPIKTVHVDSNTNNILFLGGYRHYPNISAVQRIANEILPIIQKDIPEAKLIIAGSHAPDEVRDLAKYNDAVIFKGFIESDDLEELYRNSQLILCPLLAGAGIKGKICEAISYMVPVVTNEIGNEGISLRNGIDGFICETDSEFAEASLKILKREVDLSEMTTNAQSKLYDLVGPDVVKKNMINSILPEVSICIVTYNQVGFLQACIASILGNTNYERYKIIVYSNGCTDGTRGYLESAQQIVPNLDVIFSESNDVFVKPNNVMMQRYPENDVVLINNDVTVTKGWLTSLVNTAYEYDKAGIVGSKILYPNGVLQEFGGELYDDGTGVNIGKNDDPNKPEYSSVKRSSFVSGCSLYMKRDLLNAIGYFDEQFHPCYCEDADICYSAWQNGYEVLVTPKSIIYHHEGGTAGTDVNNENSFKRFQKINFEKFIAKHDQNINLVNQKVKNLNN